MRYCCSQQPERDDMVGCDNGSYQYKWFHFSCLKTTAPPCKKIWYCPDCRKLPEHKGGTSRMNVIIVAFGKAVIGMADEVYRLIQKHIVKGIISVPIGAKKLLDEHSSPLLKAENIKIYEGARNNMPDKSSFLAAQNIVELCNSSNACNLVLALVSGGGSALLPFPVDGITLQEKAEAISVLSKAGATIEELNLIRQAVSKVKGGRLAHIALPAKVLSLIISDVIGDPIGLIASGATVPTDHNDEKFQALLNKFKDLIAEDRFPESVRNYLLHTPVTFPNPDDRISSYIIGNNTIALDAAAATAKLNGYEPHILSNSVDGDVAELGKCYCKLAQIFRPVIDLQTPDCSVEISEMCKVFSSIKSLMDEFTAKPSIKRKKLCLLMGGEPTVQVKGKGVGGRNQELCLHFAKYCYENSGFFERSKITFMSFGTDGQDGPTDAAGAIVDTNTWQNMIDNNTLDPALALQCNDSNTLLKTFNNGVHLVEMGITGTNVMDIHVLLFD